MKQKRFILTAIFLLVGISVFSKLLSATNSNQDFKFYDKVSTGEDNIAKLSQSDPALISHIREKYLVTPAPFNEPLRFRKNVSRNPVTQVVQKLLWNKTAGFFLECGAFDGEYLSNTIELEHYFRWEGVLVEADPKYHAELLAKKRKSWIAPVCLSPTPHAMQVRMVRHKVKGAHSSIPELHPQNLTPVEFPFSFLVKCFPLYSVYLAAFNRSEIDYLSLDVEGAEQKIIGTIPFDKLKIKVISLEYKLSSRHGNRFQQIKDHLEHNSFVYQNSVMGPTVHDAIFAHRSIL